MPDYEDKNPAAVELGRLGGTNNGSSRADGFHRKGDKTSRRNRLGREDTTISCRTVVVRLSWALSLEEPLGPL